MDPSMTLIMTPNSKKQAQRRLSRKAFLKAEPGIITRKLLFPFRKGTTPCPTQWHNKHKYHCINTKDRKQKQKIARITERQTNKNLKLWMEMTKSIYCGYSLCTIISSTKNTESQLFCSKMVTEKHHISIIFGGKNTLCNP